MLKRQQRYTTNIVCKMKMWSVVRVLTTNKKQANIYGGSNMKIINTFYHDNEGNIIKHDCTIIAHNKAFNCDIHEHFSRYAYLVLKLEKRASYRYIGCTEIKEGNIKIHTAEA